MPLPESVIPMPDRDIAPVPPGDLTTPDPLLAPIPKDMPCDRTYNGRNCCADEAKCKQAAQFVGQYKITNVVLDITPSFTNPDSPGTPNFVPTEVRKEETLAKAPLPKGVSRTIAMGWSMSSTPTARRSNWNSMN
jgi:hypothetical protein